MAETHYAYKNHKLQECPTIEDQRDLTYNDVYPDEIIGTAFLELMEFLELHKDDFDDGEAGRVARIANKLFYSGQEQLRDYFDIIEENLGHVVVRKFSYWPECEKAGVAGDFIGVAVQRRDDNGTLKDIQPE